MTRKFFYGILRVVLGFVLATPARAQYGPKKIVNAGAIIGGAVAVAAAVVIVTVVVVHQSHKKRTITGCVNSDEDGMRVTDEKDKLVYALSGNTAGVKPGDRVTLQGKKVKPQDPNKPPSWETTKGIKDFGACQL